MTAVLPLVMTQADIHDCYLLSNQLSHSLWISDHRVATELFQAALHLCEHVSHSWTHIACLPCHDWPSDSHLLSSERYFLPEAYATVQDCLQEALSSLV